MTVAVPNNGSAGLSGCKFTNITGSISGGSDIELTGVYVSADTGLQPNTKYGYKVKYKNAEGEWTLYNTTEITQYTLAKRPDIVCSRSAGIWTTN